MNSVKLVTIAAIIGATSAIVGGCGIIQKSQEPVSYGDYLSEQIFVQAVQEQPIDAPESYVRAVWVSYLDLYDIISDDETVYKKNIDEMLNNLKTINTTDIYFQVRAFGESLYNSEVIALSNNLYPSYSDSIDYLAYVVEQAHSADIKVHAWINPFRLGSSADAKVIEFCNAVNEQAPASINEYDSRMWIDPSSESMKQKNIEYIGELMTKYEFDGLHFDDYFYPTTEPSFDEYSFSLYSDNGGDLELEDWRRQSILQFIMESNKAVKTARLSAVFGISPDASIERDINKHYVDVKTLCTNKGYIDYICPQIYFGYKNEAMPYLQTITQWSELSAECDLIVGLSFYKTGTIDDFAGSGQNEWLESLDIISRQYLDSLKITNCNGIALFRYNSIFKPTEEAMSYAQVELYNLQKVI